MVLFLLSLIVATILVAIPRIRNHIAFGSITGSGIVKNGFSIAKERVEQSRIAGPVKRFLVVVLPDGKVVNPRLAEQLQARSQSCLAEHQLD